MKITFIVNGIGDTSVGIFPAQAKITIEDNYGDTSDNVEEWRECLANMYDEPMKCVHTKEEWDEILEDERRLWDENHVD